MKALGYPFLITKINNNNDHEDRNDDVVQVIMAKEN